jgi:hypothetical protein
VLAERTTPVYLVLNDGVWRVARLSDLLFRVHLIDAYAEVLGPFEAPRDPDERPAFVRTLRDTLTARLDQRRRQTPRA